LALSAREDNDCKDIGESGRFRDLSKSRSYSIESQDELSNGSTQTTQAQTFLRAVDEKARFKADLALQADDIDCRSSSFKRVPIELFGKAMLLGMGWEDKSSDNENFSRIIPRESGLGLGATSVHNVLGVKRPRSCNCEGDEEMKRRIDLKLSNQLIDVGDEVILLNKSYAGKRAHVLHTGKYRDSNTIKVSLESSHEVIELKKCDVSLSSGRISQD